jgi:hypothetical protein
MPQLPSDGYPQRPLLSPALKLLPTLVSFTIAAVQDNGQHSFCDGWRELQYRVFE